LVSSTIRFGILLLGVLVILDVLGLGQAVVSAVASLGIVGLVVSFALQDITKQFASGVLLMLSQPFQIGDTIKVGAHEGTVVNLQLRVTVLKTAGGDEILIPNAEVYTSTVINMSRYRERRFAVPFTLPLTNNLTEVRAQLLEAISTTPGIATTPPPSVICTTIADQKVSAEVRYWIARDTPNQDEITTRVIMGIHRVIEQVTGLPADAHAST
jgi:small-conductance mechanosensitive channel